MMNLVRGVRARASLVILVTAAATAYGVVSLFSLPSGIYPEVDFPRLVTVARAGDQPPEVLAAEVAPPIEGALTTVPGVRRLRTRVIRGAVEVSAQLEPGSDMNLALQRAEGRLAETELPPGTELKVERITPTAFPVLSFNLDGADPRALRELAVLVVAPALTRVPGVGLVDVAGGDVREIEVILDPAKLAAAHLLPSAIAERVGADAAVAAVGRVRELRQTMTVLVTTAATREAIAAIPVGEGGLRLSAVADVVDGAEDRTVTVTDPRGDAVLVSVSRTPGASAPRVVAAARAAAAAIKLPEGVHLEAVYDQSLLIDDALRGVRDAIFLGVGLSFLVLAFFLRDLRAGVAAALAVPVTLLATFGVVRLLGQTLNLMSLGGLAVAIGLVIDDAIVIVEAIVRRLEQGDGASEAAERGTADLLAAVVGTTATTVVVFAPLAFLEGVVGRFFGALAVTLCAAVVLSLVVSVTLVPLVAGRLLRARPAARAGALGRAYGGLVRRAARRPVVAGLAVAALAAGSVLVARQVATGFLPVMDEGAFVLDFFLPPGTSLEETNRQARKLDHILSTTKGIETFTRRTGTEMGPATATVQNSGDIAVRLSARGQRDDVFTIMDRVRERAAAEVPEARVEMIQVMQDVLDDLSGNPRPIEVKLFGADRKVLEATARAAAERLENAEELVDLFNGVQGEVPVLSVEVLPALAARLGVTAEAVAADLGVALAGKVAARVRAGDRSIGVRVRLADEVRFDPAQLGSLPLAYGPASVTLSALANVARVAGPVELTRENQRPVIILEAAVRGGDLGAAADDVERRLADLPLPPGYQKIVGGQAEGARETRRDLLGVLALGAVLVLGVLVIQLRSMRLSLVILLGAPLALVGALLTLWATGIALNASSLMGCVLLAGLVVKNGILLLEHAEAALASGHSVEEALAEAGERRLRPILMTTAATIAGLLPLAFAFGAGSELQRPLAVATIGGLVLSTLVTLFAIPALAGVVLRRRRRST